MTSTVVLLVSLFIPADRTLRDVVDVIEVNHFVDGKGELVFDQWIAWRWDGLHAKYTVVAWRILKDVREKPKQVRRERDCWRGRPGWRGGHATPLRRHDRGGWWVSQWRDEKDRVWREVAAPMYRETWTQYDPELCDRAWLPENRRAGLTRPR